MNSTIVITMIRVRHELPELEEPEESEGGFCCWSLIQGKLSQTQ